MKLPTATFTFEFLTDCFSGTAEGKNATHSELRVPPIRGHIRMWHVAAFGSTSCGQIWGSTAGDGTGSCVSVRLTEHPGKTNGEKSELLPHELKKSSLRHALPAGSRATLELTRLPLCNNEQWDKAQKAVKLWLLLGTLGLRSARAAGSVWPLDTWAPQDETALRNELAAVGYSHIVQLGDASIVKHASLKHEPDERFKLRCAASDTVNGYSQYFGDIKPARKPSPLKIKVIRLGTDYRLLLTGLATAADFAGAHRALGTSKPMGSVAWRTV